MPAVGQLITAETWVSAFTLAGLLSGSPLEIENIGTEEIRYIYNVASPTLADKVNSKVIYQGQRIVLPFGLNYVWVIGAEKDSRVNISKPSTEQNIFQNYQEANTKLGYSFKFSVRTTNLAANSNYDIGVQTGSFPLTIKARSMAFLGATELIYSAHEGSTYTGGTVVTPMNQGRLAVRAPLFSVQAGVTTTALGTQYLPNFSTLAAGSNAASRLGTEIIGDETNLKANTKHVFRINCPTGAGTATTVFLNILCYEGPLDYPL
ncbi:hypothetical protein KLEP7_gp196 [Pseudaeromonas phage vB_PpeM_ KLEP7]|nr:hypothetical protein KLEP7_gp196 [Pseudaeromonas phage vB_PpeM_ KLEP7]